MQRTGFEVSVVVPAPPDRVRDFLADLRESIRIHPLIVRVDRLNQRMPGIDRYRIRDRMRMGPMTIAFSYLVETTRTPEGDIVSDAYQFPRIHLHNVTSCTPVDGGTLVHEQVTITAPRLLVATVRREGARAHRTMLDNLAAVLAEDQSRRDLR
ncbi:SRPBCC family protein [Nocardia cyriacigeorgica]|uniref:SRPBCC family protein n=1 Tax=Nocardia cyriacigeorgica TaxID=135487 RepID=A0A6P1D2W7_9NOCA|nr:SRPBCC family protein [Nocardia cyriacigeorgica]NEW38921.1 SRPBCC family protein [Nocardia cyriacigeorgica]NEW43791.1 SRPBCC family protein [Nocardia cyriacigeorgica]NEW50352.1 SRPBCC family protein [Nocardia cyriacigeorgica]NEW54908.1 SRPBCC family protein [Nocardia cyriacigeorgica]